MGAMVVFGRPDGESRVAVEGYLSVGEMAGETVQQGDHVFLGEERQQAIGYDHGRSAGGDSVQPVWVGQVRAYAVGVRAIRYKLPSSGDDLGEVDVIPVDGGRRGDAQHPGVQASPQVKRDRVGVAGDEPKRHLVQFLGPKRDVDDGARAEAELVAVVV